MDGRRRSAPRPASRRRRYTEAAHRARLRTPRKRERRNESERPKAPRHLSVTQNRMLGRSPRKQPASCERSGGGTAERSPSEIEGRNGVGGNAFADARCRRLREAEPAQRPAGARGRARPTFRPRRRSGAREPRRLRFGVNGFRRGGAEPPAAAQRAAETTPALAGIGALRGVPARKGRTRRRLGRGERPVPNPPDSEPDSVRQPDGT